MFFKNQIQMVLIWGKMCSQIPQGGDNSSAHIPHMYLCTPIPSSFLSLHSFDKCITCKNVSSGYTGW